MSEGGTATPPRERRGTFEQRRQWWIDAGCCPRAACHQHLNTDGVCRGCGWSAAVETPPTWTVQADDDYAPTLPLALTLDDYANETA